MLFRSWRNFFRRAERIDLAEERLRVRTGTRNNEHDGGNFYGEFREEAGAGTTFSSTGAGDARIQCVHSPYSNRRKTRRHPSMPLCQPTVFLLKSENYLLAAAYHNTVYSEVCVMDRRSSIWNGPANAGPPPNKRVAGPFPAGAAYRAIK